MNNFKEENFKVLVPGTKFALQANKTYRVIGNVDPSAPDGYKQRGITKFEHPLNGENAIMHYNKDRRLWDTGLYSNSPCYSNPHLKSDDVSETLNVLNKKLIPYLREIFPVDKEGNSILENNRENNIYWDSYKFPLNQNLTIATNTPEKFFGLWVALLHGHIAPDGEQKAPRYRQLTTPYVIVDSGEKSSNNQKLAYARNKAIANFMTKIDEDKEFLVDVLKYSGFKASAKTSDSILNSMFTKWLENKRDGGTNANIFNEAVKNFSTEEGREELVIYNLLVKGVKNNKVSFQRSEYFIDTESVGNNLKEAAKLVNKNDKLKGQLLELMK